MGKDGSTEIDSMSLVLALCFCNEGWDNLPVQMIPVSPGIKMCDNPASGTNIAICKRGGIITNTIGVIPLDNNFIYSLITPGYKIAGLCSNIVVQRVLPAFTGADLLSKLKLLGCDVELFGENQPCPNDPDVSKLVWNDPLGGIYH